MTHDDINTLLKNLTAKLGIAVGEIKVSEAGGHTLFNITTKDSGALIGTRGDTLSALNHLVKRLTEGKEGEQERMRFTVDVNGYHLKHIKNLEAQAKTMADRARTFKYDVEMSPMSSYDRLIVHAALTEEPGIKTESQGEGIARRVVIKYIGEAQTAA